MKSNLSLISNWTEIDLELFQELQEIKSLERDLTVTEYYIEIIAFLAGVPPEDPVFDDMSSTELFQLVQQMSWIWGVPDGRPKDWNGLKPKPLDTLTLGEFIDMEHFIVEETANVSKIAALLWRKTRLDDWGTMQWEPYEYDLNSRAEEILRAPVSHIWPAINQYKKWRETFFSNYAELFAPPDQPSDEPEEDGEPDADGNFSRTQAKQAEILAGRYQKWSWESLIWSLANEDITRIPAIFNLPVLLVFNMLSMRHSLREQ